ncbi:hypothetical protein F5Y14DRAFT_403544 [Nemania sp. NC0429]|nr:hypothetical protein F5Y14DRAFT_403544 [Nemania sp. NC0429]
MLATVLYLLSSVGPAIVSYAYHQAYRVPSSPRTRRRCRHVLLPNLCEKVYHSVRVVCCSLVTTSQIREKSGRLVAPGMEA